MTGPQMQGGTDQPFLLAEHPSPSNPEGMAEASRGPSRAGTKIPRDQPSTEPEPDQEGGPEGREP